MRHIFCENTEKLFIVKVTYMGFSVKTGNPVKKLESIYVLSNSPELGTHTVMSHCVSHLNEPKFISTTVTNASSIVVPNDKL